MLASSRLQGQIGTHGATKEDVKETFACIPDFSDKGPKIWFYVFNLYLLGAICKEELGGQTCITGVWR
jgi:hypothetical protein